MTSLPVLEWCVAAVGWWVLLVCGVAGWVRRSARRGAVGEAAAPGAQRALWPLALLCGGALAFLLRLRLGFVPLHANNHAWQDAALSLHPGAAGPGRAAADVVTGPALRMAQASLASLAGGHLEALAWVGSGVGAVAAVLLALAARALGGRRAGLWALLAAAVTPLTVRVAASESVVVFAQLLTAAAVLIAARPGLVPTGPALAATSALLALGHVVGPAWALSATGLAVALRHLRRCGGASRAAPWERHTLVGPARWGRPTREAVGLGLWAGLPAVGAGALRLASARVELRAQVGDGSLATTPELGHFLSLDPAFFSPLALALALAGVAWTLARAARGRPAARLAAGGALGVVTLGVWSGSALMACTTDGLRYQSVTAVALLGLGAAPLGRLLRAAARGPRRRWLPLVLVCAVCVDAAWPRAGMGFADSQAAGWAALRAAIPSSTAVQTFVVTEAGPYARALPDAPEGRWSSVGPTSRRLPVHEALARCRRGQALPPDTWVWLPPLCDARGRGQPPCAALQVFERVRAAGSARGRVDLAPGWGRQGVRSEFLRFAEATAEWRLSRAGCPR